MEKKPHPALAAIRTAFPQTIPVLTGYLVLGIAYGVLMQTKGYGVSMLGRYRGLGAAKGVLIYTLSDETFSIVSSVEPPADVPRKDFYLAVSLLNYGYWAAGSVLGAVAGRFITFDTTGLDFALTGLFVVLFIEQVTNPQNRMSGVIGLVCSAAALAVFGAGNLVIPAMVLILAVLLIGRKKL